MPEGPVALEDVRDALYSELLATAQEDNYQAVLNQWIADANAVIDRDAMERGAAAAAEAAATATEAPAE